MCSDTNTDERRKMGREKCRHSERRSRIFSKNEELLTCLRGGFGAILAQPFGVCVVQRMQRVAGTCSLTFRRIGFNRALPKLAIELCPGLQSVSAQACVRALPRLAIGLCSGLRSGPAQICFRALPRFTFGAFPAHCHRVSRRFGHRPLLGAHGALLCSPA